MKIICNLEVFQLRGVTVDDVKHYFDFLSSTLGGNFKELVPTNIIDTQSLDRIIILYEALNILKDVRGFEKHASEYSESRFLSTLFVSRLAHYLKERVDELELEPVTSNEEGNDVVYLFITTQLSSFLHFS